MDQYTRRIVGFGTQRGVVDGMALCRMFKQAIQGAGLPKYLSSDHDPLYRFRQWEANLRILDVTEIKTVPYTPWSHPFIERLIGTIRRECLDRLLFWPATDLEMKLIAFRDYYNGYRGHAGLKGETPVATPESRDADSNPIDGKRTAGAYFKRLSQHEHEFASHRSRKPRQHQVLIPEMLEIVLRDHMESSTFQGPEDFLFHKNDGSPVIPTFFAAMCSIPRSGDWGYRFSGAPADSTCSVIPQHR